MRFRLRIHTTMFTVHVLTETEGGTRILVDSAALFYPVNRFYKFSRSIFRFGFIKIFLPSINIPDADDYICFCPQLKI